MEHTKGKWHRNIKPASKYNTIFAGRNTHVAHLSTQGLTEEEIEGNCNLIAAAPELLTVVQNFIEAETEAHYDEGRTPAHDGDRCNYCIAVKVVQKATEGSR